MIDDIVWYKKNIDIRKNNILKILNYFKYPNVIFKSSTSTYYATKIISILILGWVDLWFFILDLEYLEINFFYLRIKFYNSLFIRRIWDYLSNDDFDLRLVYLNNYLQSIMKF